MMTLPELSLHDPFADSRTEGPEPSRSYLICATPRSGSWYLVDLLRHRRDAGVPREYFRLDSSGRLPELPFQDFLSQVLRHGTTANGIFGVKVHWPQLLELIRVAYPGRQLDPSPWLLDGLLPNPQYIWLKRANRARQAISWYRAITTDAWWMQTNTTARQAAEAMPDFEGIAELESILERYDASWERFFQWSNIRPLQIVYEDLCARPRVAVDQVLGHIGVESSGGRVESRLRAQADEHSERWLELYLDYRADSRRAKRSPEPVAVWNLRRPLRSSIAAGRRWIKSSVPFDHVRATDVFVREQYAAMSERFDEISSIGATKSANQGFARGIPGYDASGYNFSPGNYGPFGLFVGREWLELLARLFGVSLSGHVLCGLHHHEPGSADGFLHHDLNPGFFADYPDSSGVVVARQELCSYTTGEAYRSDVRVTETVRGIAMIYFLSNPPWRRGDGGQTGLYSGPRDNINDPVVAIPPINNSLVLFRCSPRSFHSFISNRRSERNSVIAWYHRPKADVVREHGIEAIRAHRRPDPA
jgi:LPS sulfotransferase NodH